MTMLYVWIAVAITALIVETMAPGLVSIWFTVGAIPPLILSIFLGNNLIWLQIVLFIAVSLISFLLVRPVVYRKTATTLTNSESLLGRIAKCTRDIRKYETGEIKIGGLFWTAELDSLEEEIKEGELVKITDIIGNKLIVKAYKEEK